MPIARYGRRWRLLTLLLFVALAASWVWYRQTESFLHGGTPMGLVYGFVTLFLMLFLLYFGVRKRAYRSRFGKVEEWLQAHIWIGIFSFFVMLAHTGFRFEDKVAVALFVVISATIASGIFGAILYRTVPRELTAVQSNLTGEEISAQLNQLTKSMARIATGKSVPFQQIYYGLLKESLPGFLAGWRLLLSKPAKAIEKKGRWTELVARVDKREQDDLRQLLVLSRQHKELHLRLLYQQRYMNVLDFWLYLHVPLSIAMVVLIVAHVWGALMWGGEIRFW